MSTRLPVTLLLPLHNNTRTRQFGFCIYFIINIALLFSYIHACEGARNKIKPPPDDQYHVLCLLSVARAILNSEFNIVKA
jgi:hypothetical protein